MTDIQPICVILADDHAVVRKGIREFLDAEEDIEVVAEAADGAQAVALVAEHQPHVAVLDIQMPGFDGFGVVKGALAAVATLTPFAGSVHAAEIGAFALGLDNAAGLAVDEQHVIGWAGIGIHFAHGDAESDEPATVNVPFVATAAALLTGSFLGHFDFGQQWGLALPRGLNLSTSLLFEVSICLAVLGSASYMLDTLGHPGEEVK